MPTLYYTEDHEWMSVDGDIATIGITVHAQEQLGDLVFVDLPNTGTKIAKGDGVVVVESVKAASDVYAPIDGEIIEINEALSSDPSLVNQNAESSGWLWRMKLSDKSQLDTLLNKAAYDALIG